MYTEWKDEWETMMEGFEEKCDNATYLLHSMETEDIRQRMWLEDRETSMRWDGSSEMSYHPFILKIKVKNGSVVY